MSLFQYFQRSGKNRSLQAFEIVSIKNNLPENINDKELDSIQERLMLTADAKNKKRVVYEEKDKQVIAKYATVGGVTAAIRKFKQKFPNLNENTVHPWVKKYKEILKAKKNNGENSGFVPLGKLEVDHYSWITNLT